MTFRVGLCSREADVMWAKRIWQVIDLRQKINQTMYFPIDELENRKSLFDVIRIGLIDQGSITAYGTGPTQEDDEFRYPLGQTELDSMLNPVVIRYRENLDTGEKEEVRNVEEVTSRDVVSYKIKEDWIFDKQRSERYVRIIGIAPIVFRFYCSFKVIAASLRSVLSGILHMICSMKIFSPFFILRIA